ncbi:hypothetical protein MVEN_02562600 [Mycena venus]|uniref:Uncharacterized protein n=1 Tax=Mycena venus TaxID=2733690 RepID=A0A8H6TZA6_9AGAR|nr:hypothetical protein MVEN_02562600 [Mycena venus]
MCIAALFTRPSTASAGCKTCHLFTSESSAQQLQQIHDVDATWKILEGNYVESLDVRLEYWDAEKILITFASERLSLIFYTNRDVPLPDRVSISAPSFACRNVEHAEPQFFIIFECAWSQSVCWTFAFMAIYRFVFSFLSSFDTVPA